jgi:hypothetical protein
VAAIWIWRGLCSNWDGAGRLCRGRLICTMTCSPLPPVVVVPFSGKDMRSRKAVSTMKPHSTTLAEIEIEDQRVGMLDVVDVTPTGGKPETVWDAAYSYTRDIAQRSDGARSLCHVGGAGSSARPPLYRLPATGASRPRSCLFAACATRVSDRRACDMGGYREQGCRRMLSALAGPPQARRR